MTQNKFAIWWLSPLDFEAIGDSLPTALPEYVEREYLSARGRNGRGRLWVAPELGEVPPLTWTEPETAIMGYVDNCCGIVLPVQSVPWLMHLPGLVTDMHARRCR